MTTDIFSQEPSDNPFAVIEGEEKPQEGKEEEKSNEENSNEGLDLFVEEEEKEEKEEKVVEEEEKKEEKKEKVKATPPKKEEDLFNYSALYKSLVKKNKWFPLADDEGNPLEEVELDAEAFDKLAIQQAEWKYEQFQAERDEAYGLQFKQLKEHLGNGGNMQDLLESYQEQTDIESIDHNTLDGAEQILREYAEALDWSKEDVDDFIETQKDKGEDKFKALAEKRKADLVKNISSEREQIMKAQEQMAQRQKAVQEKKNNDLKEKIAKSDLPLRDQKAIEAFYFQPKIKVEGGYITQFQATMGEVSQDPEKLFNFIRYAYNPDAFADKKKAENSAAEKIYKQVREGSQFIKKSSHEPSLVSDDNRQKSSPTTFKQFKN